MQVTTLFASKRILSAVAAIFIITLLLAPSFTQVSQAATAKEINVSVDVAMDFNSYAEYLTLRTGEAHMPQVESGEPLALECEHFIARVRDRQPARSDGNDGIRVLRVLAAAQRSLESGGIPVEIEPVNKERST